MKNDLDLKCYDETICYLMHEQFHVVAIYMYNNNLHTNAANENYVNSKSVKACEKKAR